jgi:hypothetical protein
MPVLGLDLSTFTTVHVILCVVALASGLIVSIGLLGSKRLDGLTGLYLVSNILANATGFGFPFEKLLPSHILAIITLVVLLIAVLARYAFHLAGASRWIFAVCAVLGVYFQVFVLIVQAFAKLPGLHALAPTQTEPPFAIAQGVALVIFVIWAIVAAIRFHPPGRGAYD